MDERNSDRNKKDDEPSTSKRGSREDNVSRGDQETNEDMADSDSSAGLSDADMETTRPNLAAGPILKTEAKSRVNKKKTKQLASRIKKRERPPAKRQRKLPKRNPKTKVKRRERDLSVSTIFTKLSSSGYRTPGCERCGHRCCLRRYEYESRKRSYRNNRDRIRKNKQYGAGKKFSKKEYVLKISEGNQAGSRSEMLSPLFISTNSAPDDHLQQPGTSYCEINPEMIYEALRRLTMWKQDVPTNSILEYIIQNYPVNNEKSELLVELSEKLVIAAIVGIVTRSSADTWGLAHDFPQRRLTMSHVSIFWKVYADTLKPIAKKEDQNIQNQEKTVKEMQT